MPLPVSQRFLDALASGDQTRVVSAQVWNRDTPLVDLGNVTDGSVLVDVTQPIRRTCSLTVVSQGLEVDDLVPTNIGSPLHPASGNELRLFRGFDYDPGNPLPWQQRLAGAGAMSDGVLLSRDGTVEMCALGVFRMTKPKVVDSGDAVTISVIGNDRAALVSARKWLDVWPIASGTDLRTAVHDLIQSRAADLGLVYKLARTYGITVPNTAFGTDLAGQNDPVSDAVSLATAAAMELFFDVSGALVMQLLPDPSLVPASFGTLYSEGVNCMMVEAERDLDESGSYNGVIVIGVGSGGAPVQAEVWDTDPTSPTWVGGPWGYQPYIYQTSLIPASPSTSNSVAYSQALRMAQTLFVQVRSMLDTPEFQCVPNPALLESDAITLVRKRIGLSGSYTSAQMTIPLDASAPEVITCRPKNVPIGEHPPPPFVLGAHGG